jgi:hypothetical protein
MSTRKNQAGSVLYPEHRYKYITGYPFMMVRSTPGHSSMCCTGRHTQRVHETDQPPPAPRTPISRAGTLCGYGQKRAPLGLAPAAECDRSDSPQPGAWRSCACVRSAVGSREVGTSLASSKTNQLRSRQLCPGVPVRARAAEPSCSRSARLWLHRAPLPQGQKIPGADRRSGGNRGNTLTRPSPLLAATLHGAGPGWLSRRILGEPSGLLNSRSH